MSSQTVLLIALFFVAAFPLGKIIILLNARFKFWLPKRAVAADPSEALLAEEPSVGAFFMELRDGLIAPAPHPVAKAVDPLQAFFDSAPGQLASLRTLFSEISRVADEATRQTTLREFLDPVRRLKEASQMLELRPVWVMACALEGLLKQLLGNASNVTPSVLATAAGAVDLLEVLCVRGLNPNLASDPPVRLLAVDDDAVSRLAISFALKKAFNEPDLAPDGEAALALTALQSYDVIFLDVEMPGMDGFELCTKIHATVTNRTTPVVFVTSHSDFGSRAKSSLSGGRDLIAKPFLAFEITVKALTLALRARLLNGVAEAFSANKEVSDPSSVAAGICTGERVAAPSGAEVSARTEEQRAADGESNTVRSSDSIALTSTAQSSGNSPAAPERFAAASDATTRSPWELGDRGFRALFGEKAESRKQKAETGTLPSPFQPSTFPISAFPAEEFRNQLQAARHAAEPAALHEFLGKLYPGVHSLTLESDRTEMRTISRLSSTLEGLLKKLLEQPKLCTPSTLNAAAASLDLLGELCHAGCNPDLAHPPIRLLVVDDDPIALRAISTSLQLVFGRPDSADSGEAALALSAEKPFDLIFLDVLMPGIDGFTTCTKIHETAPNRQTPVVFVTSRNDLESRSQAAESGGCGFIPKPVLASEITLTALTFTLRARLNKIEPAPAREETACLPIT